MNFWNEEKLKEALQTAKTYNFPENWSSNGLIIWQGNFEYGNMILARSDASQKGVLLENFPNLIKDCSAILSVNATKYFKYNKPVVELVGSNSDAIIKLARYIRKFFTGKVIGITGSSGKSTTTQMLVDIFSSKYKTDSNIESKANTSWGLSWNMTRFGVNDDYWIIETSLGGGMSRNSAIVKPDYAIITNVAPVHLTGGMQLEDIAEEKSRIFHSMKEGAVAVIYSGMKYFETVKNAAEFKGLKIVTFGENETDDIRIISENNENKFVINGTTYLLNAESVGKHILLDMAAALGVVKEDGFPIEDALEVLRHFKTLEGRGEEFEAFVEGVGTVNVTDESYNANPLSMNAAITAFGEKYADKNKVVILGDMAECGVDSEKYHKELAIPLCKINPQKVLLCGTEIKVLQDEISDKFETKYYESVGNLMDSIQSELCDGDYVFLKSSHSGNLYKLAEKLKNSTI